MSTTKLTNGTSKLSELCRRYPTLGPDLVREIYREGWEAAYDSAAKVYARKAKEYRGHEQVAKESGDGKWSESIFDRQVGISALWSDINWELRKEDESKHDG